MKIKDFKKRIYGMIRDDDENNIASDIFDGVIITLIIINLVMVIADTFNLSSQISRIFNVVEIVSVIIFTIEYILRLWTSDLKCPEVKPLRARIRYIFSFMALIDLIAILPFYIPFIIPIDLKILRALRIIRLFRVFKVDRYTHALSSIGLVFKKKKQQLISSMFIVILLMIMASVLMCSVEKEAQPEAFSNAFSALWWAVTTLTTVGYGDIYPITTLGKILSAIIALLGIGLIAVPTGIISAGFIENGDHKEDDKNDEKKSYCPYCGKKLD
ncbi:MAG: ion transporter [Clostridiales bacterium]|jgi:voltage-gated potassium channel|nr:ion transporter [Clostridiales bacterium]